MNWLEELLLELWQVGRFALSVVSFFVFLVLWAGLTAAVLFAVGYLLHLGWSALP
jgi:hypothetical protein